MLEMRMSLGCGVSASLSWYQVQYHAACMHTDHETLTHEAYHEQKMHDLHLGLCHFVVE